MFTWRAYVSCLRVALTCLSPILPPEPARVRAFPRLAPGGDSSGSVIGRAEPCPIVPRARESIHRRTRLFHRQVPGLSTINDRPDAFYTMSDKIIDPLSDGNANGSDSSRQTSTEHGEPMRNEENVVTDGPQIGQPGATETNGVRPSNHSAPEDGPLGSGSGNAAPTSKLPPRKGGDDGASYKGSSTGRSEGRSIGSSSDSSTTT